MHSIFRAVGSGILSPRRRRNFDMKRSADESLPDLAPSVVATLKKLRVEPVSAEAPAPTPVSSVHRFEKVAFGILQKRYKRFLADVILDKTEETVTAHCPNTGPLLGLLDQTSPKVLLTKSTDPKRKCPYTLQAIQLVQDLQSFWIGIHSSLANKMVHHMLKEKMIPHFVDFDKIRPEAVYGKDKKSRADFLLSCSETDRKMYVEVKAVTYSEKRGDIQIGLFPDTKSTRAQKHMQELMDVMESGAEVACVFVVLGNPCTAVGPFKEKDAKFAELMKEGNDKGVKMIGIGLELDCSSGNGCDFVFKRFLDIEIGTE